ncbi:MAG: thioesterase family protein [Candidatus Competibacteraceae bacterium]|nr:thioesterase family protein [Candidatus Competibacteraceae bacterium]
MRDDLQPGLTGEFDFVVPATKTVPHLYPEAPEFQAMPHVFATGFMVGLIEWACIQALKPYLDWPREQSVGTHVDLSHTAATPPGFTVSVKVKLVEREGKKLKFAVEAHDGIEPITRGTHERFVIDAAKFNAKVAEKAARRG